MLDASSAAIEGAIVEYRVPGEGPLSRQVVTGGDGTFEIVVFDTTATLHVPLRGVKLSGTVPADNYTPSADQIVTVAPGQTVENVSISLEKRFWSFVRLRPVPGGSSTRVQAVNFDRASVGQVSMGDTDRPVVWDATGTPTFVPVPPGVVLGQFSEGQDINGAGNVIVNWQHRTPAGQIQRHAYLHEGAAGAAHDLRMGASESFAERLNDDNHVVGTRGGRGYYWQPNPVLPALLSINLTPYNNGFTIRPRAISSTNLIVGQATLNDGLQQQTSSAFQLLFQDPPGVTAWLPTYLEAGGYTTGFAAAVSNPTNTVYGSVRQGGRAHACAFTLGDPFRLAEPIGAMASILEGVNSARDAVGELDPTGAATKVIWFADSAFATPVEWLIRPDSGIRRAPAAEIDINDRKDVVINISVDDLTSYLLIPPEAGPGVPGDGRCDLDENPDSSPECGACGMDCSELGCGATCDGSACVYACDDEDPACVSACDDEDSCTSDTCDPETSTGGGTTDGESTDAATSGTTEGATGETGTTGVATGSGTTGSGTTDGDTTGTIDGTTDTGSTASAGT